MRISDWSSDVCSSDLARHRGRPVRILRHRHGDVEAGDFRGHRHGRPDHLRLTRAGRQVMASRHDHFPRGDAARRRAMRAAATTLAEQWADEDARSEEHTSELQSLMRISYAVFCLKKKTPT